MKFSIAFNLALLEAARVRRSNQGEKALGDVDKRYSQLVDMMNHYNNDFDERKYWAYGCNCLILGKLFQRIQEISKRFHLIPSDSTKTNLSR